jgi:D-serine deaminase-like pyridoxal phosphate-dependent protein
VFFDRQVGAWRHAARRLRDARDRDRRQPARGSRVIFDAGSKTLTTDAPRGFGAVTGYGLVFPDLETGKPLGSVAIERLSEEHGVARVLPDCPLKPGDRVRILPNHSCVVTNLADELVLVDGLEVVERIRVEARGRNY